MAAEGVGTTNASAPGTASTSTTPASAEPTGGAPAAAAPAASTPSWRDALPEGLKAEKTLERFPNVAALADSYMHLKRSQDGSVKIPGKDAKPEELAAYRERLGVPKVPSDYKLEVPKDAPPDFAVDAERFARATPVFHKLGLTNEQVQGLAEWAATEDRQRKAQETEAWATQLDQMASDWGTTVFDKRAADVQALVRHFADDATKAWLGERELHPGLFKMLYPIARDYVEQGVIES